MTLADIIFSWKWKLKEIFLNISIIFVLIVQAEEEKVSGYFTKLYNQLKQNYGYINANSVHPHFKLFSKNHRICALRRATWNRLVFITQQTIQSRLLNRFKNVSPSFRLSVWLMSIEVLLCLTQSSELTAIFLTLFHTNILTKTHSLYGNQIYNWIF